MPLNFSFSKSLVATLCLLCALSFTAHAVDESYQVYASGESYYLKTDPTWVPISGEIFIIIPVYDEGDILKLTKTAGVWQVDDITFGQFSAVSPALINDATVGYSNVNGDSFADLYVSLGSASGNEQVQLLGGSGGFDVSVVLPLEVEGAYWATNRVFENEDAIFSWRVTGGNECVNESGDSVGSSGHVTLTSATEAIITKTITCDNKSFSDTLAVLPNPSITLPTAIGNPITENPIVVGSIPDSLSVGPMGNARYTMPIATAAGSGGLVPDISISYDSGANNGLLGVGWSISGISVLRKCAKTITEDNEVGTIEDKSRLCLDGKKLLLVSGEYLAANAEYQLVDRTPMKIVAGNDLEGNDVDTYTVAMPSGDIYTYSRHSFETWPLTKKLDAAGNYIVFNYADTTSAVQLNSIQYTGNEKAGTSPNNAIFFHYETRDDIVVQRERKIKARLDYIQSRVNVTNLSSGSGNELRTYDIEYKLADVSGRSLIKHITSCAGDTCLPSTDFVWQEGNLDFANSQDVKIESNSDTEDQRALDANGDGITDFWIIDDDAGGSDHIRVVQGGSLPTHVDSKRNAANSGFRNSWQVIDFDNDGRDDVIFNSGGWKVYRSTVINNNPATINYDFNNPISVNIPSSIENIKIADFDGDGFADILYYDEVDGQLYIQYKTISNNNYSTAVNVSPAEFDVPYSPPFPPVPFNASVHEPDYARKEPIDSEQLHTFFSEHNPIKNGMQVGDFDGDGKSEIVFGVPEMSQNWCNFSDHFANGKKDFYGKWRVYTLGSNGFDSNWVLGEWNSANAEVCDGLLAIDPTVITRASAIDIDQDGSDEIVSEHLSFEDGRPGVQITLKVQKTDRYYRHASLAFSTIFETEIFDDYFNVIQNNPYHYLFSDYDTDGDLDFLFYKNAAYNTNHNGKEVWKVIKSNNSSFFSGGALRTDNFTNIEHVYNPGGVNTFVDMNGDGMPDYISFQGHLNYQISQSKKRDLLTSITNGFGQSTTIQYKSLSDENAVGFYSRENNAADLDDPRCQSNGYYCSKIIDVEIPIHAVQQVSVEDESQTYYQYKGLKAQHGVGLLGFSEVIAFENKSNIRVISKYHQVFPYTGKLFHTEVAQVTSSQQLQCDFNFNSGEPDCDLVESLIYVPLSSTNINYAEYEDTTCSTVGSQVCATYNEQFIYPETVTEQKYDVDNTHNILSVTTTTNTDLDKYGHIGTTTKIISDGTSDIATLVTSKGYEHFTAVYGGRLTNESVNSSRPGEDTVTQAVTYTYNPSNNYLLESKEIDNASNFGSTVNDSLSANFTSKETYTRDSFGNVTFLEKTAAGATPQLTGFTYDNYGRYVTDQHQYIGSAAGQLTNEIHALPSIHSATTYHAILGLPLTTTSANDQVTTNGYNALGRLNYTFNPDGSYATVIQELCATSNDCPTNGYYVETTEVSNGPNSKVYFDKKGLKLREKSQSLTNVLSDTVAWIQKDYAYDHLNRKVIESVPYLAGDLAPLSNASSYSAGSLPPLGYSYTVFDDFNRVTSLFKPDHGRWKTSYQGLTSTSTNPDQMKTITVKNILGEVVSVTNANTNAVTYNYNALGKMRLVSREGDNGTVTSHIKFDHLGRKVQMTDPDVGVVKYRYDGFGNLLWQQDAKNQRKCSIYDGLGRLKESYNVTSATCSKSATLDAHIEYSYDLSMYGVGLVSYVYDHINEVGKQYYYNALSQVYREETTVDGKSYFQDAVYDSDHQFRIKTAYDASGGNGGVTYQYSIDNYLIGKTDLVSGEKIWELLKTDVWGNATEFKYGNDIVTTKEYDAYDSTISNIYDASRDIQDNEYHFTNVGNLTYRKDHVSGFDEQFGYDSLNRLDDWTKTGGGASGTVDVNYDSLGNIAFKTGVGTYHYDNTAHAVSRITGGSTSSNLAGSYAYDANGNMTSGGGRSLINYNVNNKPLKISSSGSTTHFVYSLNDARIKRSDIKGNVTTDTLYIGNVEFVTVSGELNRIQRAIEGLAIQTYFASTNITQLEYLHFDHLGSADVITDKDGAVVKRFSFDPWGQRRSVDNYNTTFGFVSSLDLSLSYYNKGFTGHEQLDDSGLIHMNGRVYDPRLGRFLSADPMVQQEYNLQNLNRYSYVLNNPLNATDPSGYFWAELFSAVAEYFTSDSFAQSVAMAGVSYASNGGVQFTYSSAGAFSYGQGAQRSLESQLFDSYDLGGRSSGLVEAKGQAHLSGANVTSGVSGGKYDGTYFFGGAGIDGDYIGDMVSSFQEAGISDVHAVSGPRWSSNSGEYPLLGTGADAFVGVLALNEEIDMGDRINTTPEKLVNKGDGKGQFNLVGYSYGSLVAAQVAMTRVKKGGTVDNLVLIGSPITPSFLKTLRSTSAIKNVIVIDLTQHGDTLKAGMSGASMFNPFVFVPLAEQFVSGTGHFHYAPMSQEGNSRRRQLAKDLYGAGLR